MILAYDSKNKIRFGVFDFWCIQESTLISSNKSLVREMSTQSYLSRISNRTQDQTSSSASGRSSRSSIMSGRQSATGIRERDSKINVLRPSSMKNPQEITILESVFLFIIRHYFQYFFEQSFEIRMKGSFKYRIKSFIMA